MKTPDLEYIKTGLFTRFMPNTSAGEDAWRVMHEANGETVLSIHAAIVATISTRMRIQIVHTSTCAVFANHAGNI